jgi:enoyl-CoA hydratase
MSFKTITTEIRENILIAVIDRPEKLNPLSVLTLRELSQVVEHTIRQDEIYGLIITGRGDKSFVAGADIAEFRELTPEKASEMARFGQHTLKRIETCSKPVLAAINGLAFGGGCELAMACHLRIAAEHARFSQPEVNLGIMAGYGGTQRLIQYIGKTRAMEMHLTGKVINAATALQWGLLNEVVAADALLTRSMELMKEVTGKSPFVITSIIKSVNGYFDNLDEGFITEVNEFGRCFEHDDYKEGLNAFYEKRKPNFRKQV